MKDGFVSGLDLGQAQDFTAWAVLEQQWRPNPDRPQGRPLAHYALRHLERVPLGTPYPEVVARLVAQFARPPLAGSLLAVDETGVGRPVLDLLRRAPLQAQVRPITITGGHAVGMSTGGGTSVPKKDLVSTLQVLLQSRRIQFAKRLPATALLVQELLNFQVKVTATANETFGALRGGQHDDLVMALALAAWQGEHLRSLNIGV